MGTKIKSNNGKQLMPQLSVIIPIYNVEEYLEECLDSVIGQTFKDIEIICVNDGSTDNSLKILKKYAAKIVIDQKNQGLGAARNNALKIAKSHYVAFVDSDDYHHPQHIRNRLTTY